MPIQFNSRVYKTEKRARKFYEGLKRTDKGVHEDYKVHPHIKYLPEYKRWIVSWTVVYPEERLTFRGWVGRRRKKKK